MLDPDNWRVSSAQLCELLGVTHKQLSRWHTDGMPKIGRGEWDLRTAIQWLIAHVSGEGELGNDAVALAAARQSLIQAQNRKLDIEIERLEGSIYDADVVHAVMDQLAVIVSSAHNALPARAPALVGQTVADIEFELETECRSIAEAIANRVESFKLAAAQGGDSVAAPAPEA